MFFENFTVYALATTHFKNEKIGKDDYLLTLWQNWEGNQVADVLINFGTTSTGLVWWNSGPPFIFEHCDSDCLDLPKFRFR